MSLFADHRRDAQVLLAHDVAVRSYPPIIHNLSKFETTRAQIVSDARKLLGVKAVDERLESCRVQLLKLADANEDLGARRLFFVLSIGWRRRLVDGSKGSRITPAVLANYFGFDSIAPPWQLGFSKSERSVISMYGRVYYDAGRAPLQACADRLDEGLLLQAMREWIGRIVEQFESLQTIKTVLQAPQSPKRRQVELSPEAISLLPLLSAHSSSPAHRLEHVNLSISDGPIQTGTVAEDAVKPEMIKRISDGAPSMERRYLSPIIRKRPRSNSPVPLASPKLVLHQLVTSTRAPRLDRCQRDLLKSAALANERRLKQRGEEGRAFPSLQLDPEALRTARKGPEETHVFSAYHVMTTTTLQEEGDDDYETQLGFTSSNVDFQYEERSSTTTVLPLSNVAPMDIMDPAFVSAEALALFPPIDAVLTAEGRAEQIAQRSSSNGLLEVENEATSSLSDNDDICKLLIDTNEMNERV